MLLEYVLFPNSKIWENLHILNIQDYFSTAQTKTYKKDNVMFLELYKSLMTSPNFSFTPFPLRFSYWIWPNMSRNAKKWKQKRKNKVSQFVKGWCLPSLSQIPKQWPMNLHAVVNTALKGERVCKLAPNHSFIMSWLSWPF